MDIHPIFESVRQHLQQGETGAALQILISYLESDGKQSELLRTLRVVQANFNAAKQQELKGILAFQEAQREYSKVNDALLSTMDDLSAGRTLNSRIPVSPNRLPWIIGGVILLVGIVAGALFFRARNASAKTDGPPAAACPDFSDSNYKIMLLPFVGLSEQQSKPEQSIQVRIRELTRNNNLITDVEISPEQNLNGLPDFNKAAAKGLKCKADVVVWGQYDKVGDSILVDIHFVFSSEPKFSGHTAFQPFRSLSALQMGIGGGKGGELRSLDDAILSFCSILAVHAGKPELAEKWLAKIGNVSEKDDSLSEAIAQVRENIKNLPTPIERLQERRKKK